MEKRKNLLKRTVAILMSLVMAAGMFMWNRVDVKADDPHYYWEWEPNDMTYNTFLLTRASDQKTDWEFPVLMETGQVISLCDRSVSQIGTNYSISYYLNGKKLCEDAWNIDGGGACVTIGKNPLCTGYTKWLMTPIPDETNPSLVYDWKLEAVIEEASSAGGQSDNKAPQKQPAAPRTHTHSYFWVTVQEAGTDQDGIEEYRCSCGDVQERNIIPASEVLVKGLFGEIKDAPLNGSATFDTGRQYTLSDHIIRKLAERTDVTTVITFEYEGQSYRMTIPAGADYSQLLADEDYFYGYFYFANAVGAVIEAL